MRALLLTTLLSLPIFLAAQTTNISSSHREYCEWNPKSQDFDICTGTDESSLFTINEAETMFDHVTPTISSTYYIKKKEYNEKTGIVLYNVVSDVGNKYVYAFDFLGNEVRALYNNEETGESFVVKFAIKKFWTD